MATVGQMTSKGTFCLYDDGDRKYHDLYEEQYKVMGFEDSKVEKKSRLTSKVDIEAIRAELKCSVCLELIHDAVSIKACLHSFCEACISQQISTNKCCPLCKVHVNSHRDFETNQTLRNLVAIVDKSNPQPSDDKMAKPNFDNEEHKHASKVFHCSICNGFKKAAASKCTGMCAA